VHAGDRARAELVEYLARCAELVAAERAAVIWVDEYGEGLVHTHLVLDLGRDRPRRDFDVDPMRVAWTHGVPGLVEFGEVAGSISGVRLPPGIRSCALCTLGSDGTRAWFVAVDSCSPRMPLDPATAEDLMYVAGRIGGLVLHAELDGRGGPGGGGPDGGVLGERPAPPVMPIPRRSFDGWTILRDIEDQRGPDARLPVGVRFAVYRAAFAYVDEEGVVPGGLLDAQVESARRAVREFREKHGEQGSTAIAEPVMGDVGVLEEMKRAEVPCWEKVLDLLDNVDAPDEERDRELAVALYEWGEAVDAQGHHLGAEAIYRVAYRVAGAVYDHAVSMKSARRIARALRRRSLWPEAEAWYGAAFRLAEVLGDRKERALALDGMCEIHRARGNLPRARELAEEVLAEGEALGDGTVLGLAYLALQRTEKAAGRVRSAIPLAWKAIEAYPTSREKVWGLMALANAFRMIGDLESAERTYRVVLTLADDWYYRVYAMDAFAFMAACRGDRAEYERRLAKVDEEPWKSSGRTYMIAEFLYYRGIAWAMLEDDAAARKWLERARHHCAEFGLNEYYFKVDRALEDLRQAVAEVEASTVAEEDDAPWTQIEGVRRGVEKLAAAADPA